MRKLLLLALTLLPLSVQAEKYQITVNTTNDVVFARELIRCSAAYSALSDLNAEQSVREGSPITSADGGDSSAYAMAFSVHASTLISPQLTDKLGEELGVEVMANILKVIITAEQQAYTQLREAESKYGVEGYFTALLLDQGERCSHLMLTVEGGKVVSETLPVLYEMYP